MLEHEAMKRVEDHMTDLVISYAGIFDGFLKPIEGAAKINASLLEEATNELTEKGIYKLLELQVENNPIIYGATIAFMPDQFSSDRRLFAPYVYQKNDKLVHIDIAAQGYDYTTGEWEWWSRVIETGKAGWSEPYFDKNAGNIMMSTYSVPFYKNDKLWGIATADIALDRISSRIHIPGIKGREIIVLSSTGQLIIHWDKDEIGKSVFDLIEEKFQAMLLLTGNEKKEDLDESKTKLNQLVDDMLAGKTGIIRSKYLGLEYDYWSFFAPIKSVGWSFSLRVKESSIFKIVYEQFWYSILFFCLLLLITVIAIALVSGKFSRSLGSLITRCQRIERLNFQVVKDKSETISEIQQMSHTLNNMCLVLDSHYAIEADDRIAEAIRQHALPMEEIKVKGFQIEFCSNTVGDNCGELFDIVACTQAKPDEQQEQQDIAFLLMDDTDSGVDAAVKSCQLRAIFRTMVKQGHSLPEIAEQLNDYLISDMTLNGPVQLSLGLLESNNAMFNILNLGQNGVFYYSRQQLNRFKGSQQTLATQKRLSGLHVKNIALEPDDIVVLCSNGVFAAQNKQRKQFGIQSLEQLVEQQPTQSAHALIQSLQLALETFTAGAYMQTERSIIVIKRC
jgi:serine phosphatase RsbU (regulator of sigma subunit)